MKRRLVLVFAIGCGAGLAQQPIGTVGIQSASVVGALEVSNSRAKLIDNATVTARDHMAEVTLSRGGSVRVCATSGLHATVGALRGKTDAEGLAPMLAPLMLALDRGAIEVQMAGTTSDVVMTPDLRFTLRGNGPLDLQLRVTRNGDTCVENRGLAAPLLNVAEQFGNATYELRAGQHVLFEHGSLKEVVDHESSSCGCPPEPVMTVADALVNSALAAGGTGTVAPKTAEEQHPFPAAVSEGLAPAPPVPQMQAGMVHAQVSATLSSGGEPDSTAEPKPPETTSAGSQAAISAPPATATTSPPSAAAPPPPPRGGLVRVVGRFFRRLFGGG